MEATARCKEQICEENWRIREEEHKEELKRQEEKMMGRIQTCMQDFYNNQFKRDAELLNIMKEKEKEMENSMVRKIDGFKHIYKELFKEFEKIMKERDQQLENDYTLLECISEVEGIVNQVGERQDTLIRAVQISNETSAKGK